MTRRAIWTFLPDLSAPLDHLAVLSFILLAKKKVLFDDCASTSNSFESYSFIMLSYSIAFTYDEEGNMDFFAGFVTNLGVRNKIDPVTGLWTLHEFRKDTEELLYNNQCGAAVMIGLNLKSSCT